MRIGIVGAEGAKFTKEGERAARVIITSLLEPGDIVVSGGCHLGGIDIWAEEIAATRGLRSEIFLPAMLSWDEGYKPRNIQIARGSDYVVCIAVDCLPDGFAGMRHRLCYHCKATDHIKSGGCWTVKYARKRGIPGEVRIVQNG